MFGKKALYLPRRNNLNTNDMEEKTFFVVSTVITGSKASVRLAGTVSATEKPETKFRSTSRADYYLDYFDSLEEAEKFCEEN